MPDLKSLAISFGASALTFFVFAVIVEIIKRRLGFDPAARIAGGIDAALPRMPAQTTAVVS